MAYLVTIKLPNDMGVVPDFNTFERGICPGCPYQWYDMNKNHVVCGIRMMALPVGYDADKKPWPLCPIMSVRKVKKPTPNEKDGLRWLRPDMEE